MSFEDLGFSISDDDLCASCTLLRYRPGELSLCSLVDARRLQWPADFNADGYAVECSEFVRVHEWGENVAREGSE